MCLCSRMVALEWKERTFIERVNSRCFCWFPAAIFVYQNCTQIWRLHTKLYNGAWNVSANISETVGHMDLSLGQIIYISVFCNISFCGFFHWTVSNLFLVPCLLRDRENDLYLRNVTIFIVVVARWLHHYVRLYLMKLDSTSVTSSCFLKEKGLYLRHWVQLKEVFIRLSYYYYCEKPVCMRYTVTEFGRESVGLLTWYVKMLDFVPFTIRT